MGICGLAFGFAPNIGPTIAGICTQYWGWSSMFWGVTVASGVITLVMMAVLPHDTPRDEPRDGGREARRVRGGKGGVVVGDAPVEEGERWCHGRLFL